MWLFLASLAMLFAAMMLGYVLIRQRAVGVSIQLPHALWLSTAILLLGSICMHIAHNAARQEKQHLLRKCLLTACVLAGLFVLVQAPALWKLMQWHHAMAGQKMPLYGLIFFLILIHALHVVGGIIGVGLTTAHAFAARYDHERHEGVRHAAMYWHFLDLVWLIMFLGIYIGG